jgi:hypothetical protein
VAAVQEIEHAVGEHQWTRQPGNAGERIGTRRHLRDDPDWHPGGRSVRSGHAAFDPGG